MLTERTIASLAATNRPQQASQTASAAAVRQNPSDEAKRCDYHSDRGSGPGRSSEEGNRGGQKSIQEAGHAAPPTRPRRAEGAPRWCDRLPLPQHSAEEIFGPRSAGLRRQGSADNEHGTSVVQASPCSPQADVLPGFEESQASTSERPRQRERDRYAIASGVHPATRMPLANSGRSCGDCRFLRLKQEGNGGWWKCGTPDPRSKNHRGDGRDMTKRWPACIAFQPEDGDPT